MSRRQLRGELDAVRALVGAGRDRVAEACGTDDHPWLAGIRARLDALADDLLVTAAGGLATPARVALEIAAALGCGAAVAGLTTVLGLGPAWVITVTAIAVVAAVVGVAPLIERLSVARDRRRAVPAVSPSLPARLDHVPGDLRRARVQLVSAALRYAGRRERWRSPALRSLISSDRAARRLARADVVLCQAIDQLDTYLAATELREAG
jgi:hypothetical protein